MSAKTTLSMQDRMTGPLMKIMKAMDQTMSVMEKMNSTADKLETKGMAKARAGLQSASADMERFISSSRTARINGVQPLQNQFTNLPGPIDRASGAVRGFFTSFIGAAAAYISVQALINGIKKFATVADEYTSANARIALVNDGLQTQLQLQEKIFKAAQRSRSSYNDIASSVAKLNMLAGDAFSGNDEAIRFSELMGKAFTISGASTQERQAGMYQLTQAMAAGKLQGDEFRSIMENAPLLAQAIADAMGKSKGELKEMSAEGTITAGIIKSALFGAANDIEDKFKKMPMTFGQAMTLMKNNALMTFAPVIGRFNELVNSDVFKRFSDNVMKGIAIAAIAIYGFIGLVEWGMGELNSLGTIISDSWGLTGPAIVGATLALGVFLSMMAAYKVAAIIMAGIEAARALAFGVSQAAMMLASGATLTLTAQTWGLNAALLAFPGTWILLAFVGVIALVIYALVAWSDQTASTVGFITGVFAAMGMYVWNVFAQLWNFIASFAEFLINIFIDPTYAVQKLMYDMAKGGIDVMTSLAGSFEGAADVLAKVFVTATNIAIGGINGLIGAMNLIPGIDIGKVGSLNAATSVSILSKGMKNMANNLKAPTSSKGVVKLPRMNLGSIPAAFKAGNIVGKASSNNVSDKLNGAINKVKGMYQGAKGLMNGNVPGIDPNLQDSLGGKMGDILGKIPASGKGGAGSKGSNPTGGKLDSIGRINDEINIAEEDLKLLRDFAENRSIQQTITLTPTVTFTGNMQLQNDEDIDKIVRKIEKVMSDDIARSAEGVYT